MRTTTRTADVQSKTTLRLPANLLERAKIRAIREQRTLQEITAAGLELYLKLPLARVETEQ